MNKAQIAVALIASAMFGSAVTYEACARILEHNLATVQDRDLQIEQLKTDLTIDQRALTNDSLHIASLISERDWWERHAHKVIR